MTTRSRRPSPPCGPADDEARATEDAGFFPFAVTAVDQGDAKTLLAVTTADPAVGFGYGGEVFDATEYSPSWFIIGQGDDGRRHLFFQSWAPADAGEYACLDPATGEGDIAGGHRDLGRRPHLVARRAVLPEVTPDHDRAVISQAWKEVSSSGSRRSTVHPGGPDEPHGASDCGAEEFCYGGQCLPIVT